MAQAVGSRLAAARAVAGNSSSGYQQPPSSARVMPSAMLAPLAWLSLRTNVPSMVPSATAASPKLTSTAASPAGEAPQFSPRNTLPASTSSSICTMATASWPVMVPAR